MADTRGATRCSSVDVMRTMRTGLDTAKKRVETSTARGRVLHVDASEEQERVKKEAYEDGALTPFNLFQHAQKYVYDFTGFARGKAASFLGALWHALPPAKRAKWATMSDAVRKRNAASAEEEFTQEFERVLQARADGLFDDREKIFFPAWVFEKSVKYYTDFKDQVRKMWPQSNSCTPNEAVRRMGPKCDRSQSETPPALPSFQTDTFGPSLFTRRIVWYSKRLSPDSFFRRNTKKHNESATTAAEDDEAAEDAGIRSCPPPRAEAEFLAAWLQLPGDAFNERGSFYERGNHSPADHSYDWLYSATPWPTPPCQTVPRPRPLQTPAFCRPNPKNSPGGRFFDKGRPPPQSWSIWGGGRSFIVFRLKTSVRVVPRNS